MLNALGLGILFQARDEAREVSEKLKESLRGLHEQAEQAHHSVLSAFGGGAMIAVGASAAVLAAGGAAAFEFAEHAEKFSSAIMHAGVAAHASAEELHEFEEMAKSKALDSMRGSAIETAQTLEQLAIEGYNLEESGQAVDATLRLMAISMGALGSREAAGLVHDTLAEFGMQADESTEVVDKLAFAMREFKFRAEELRPAMSGLAAGAHLTGSSFDDVLIGVGLLKSVFPSATKAAGAMNVALQQLASAHEQKELMGIGVAVKDTHGKMRPLLEIIQSLSDKTSKLSDAQLASKLATIGSAKAAGGLSVIIEALRNGVTDTSGNLLKGSAALAYYREQLLKSDGTAKRMADMLGSDLGGALKALNGAVSNAGVAFGGMFEGGFTKAIQMANLFVRGLTQLFTQGGFSGDVKDALDKNLGVKDFVVGLFIWIKRIENFFTSLRDSFMKAFEPFQPVLDTLLATFGQLGQALGFTSQTANDNASTWDSFGAAGAGVGDTLANLAGAVIPLLTGALDIMAFNIGVAKAAWDILGPAVMGAWQVLSGVFKLVAGVFSGDWKTLWDGFVDVCAGAARMVVNIVMGTIGWFGKLIDSVGGAFGKNFGLAKEINELKDTWNGSLAEGTGVLKSVVSANAPASPGAAAIQGQAAANAAATAPLLAAAGAPNQEQVTHHHVSVNLDGEKVGETLATSRRSLRARSFESVPSSHGGSF